MTINSDDVRLQWREVIENVGKVDTIVTRYRKPTAVVIDYETWLGMQEEMEDFRTCLLYTSPSPRDRTRSRMPSSA